MRDALGGTVTLVIVVFFIVFALGYMAFNVNYTKAFRMKDKIISLYEDYDGECGGECQAIIRSYAKELGYAVSGSLVCPDRDGYRYTSIDNLYCECKVSIDQGDADFLRDFHKSANQKKYYKIITKINLDIPVISNIFDFRFFYISGDTKTFN